METMLSCFEDKLNMGANLPKAPKSEEENPAATPAIPTASVPVPVTRTPTTSLLHPQHLYATMSLEEALAELLAANPNRPLPYTILAKNYGVVRSTLTRRHQGKSASPEAKASTQRLLTSHREAGLVRYIEGLTVRHRHLQGQ